MVHTRGRTLLAASLVLCAGTLAHAQETAVARPIAPASTIGAQPEAQPTAQPTAQPDPSAPGAQFQAAPLGASTQSAVSSDELVTLSAFTEPVQLSAMVQMVATTLNINVTVKGEVPGTVVFQAPVPVKKSELLQLLDMLLEQQGWSISQDRFGIYVVAPGTEIKFNSKTESPTTRVFSTPNVRPSALKSAIDQQLAGAQGGATRYTYLDELGLIVVTDTPRRLQATADLIELLLGEFGQRQFIRLPLTHISAPVARERALQLIGSLAQSSTVNPLNIAAQMQGQAVQSGGGGPFNNLGERLTIDPQGNALIFRGLPIEIDRVRQVLTIIDVRNTLVPKQYFAGSAARQIADLARQRGLGEVSTISADGSISQGFQPFGAQQAQFGQQQQGQQGSGIGGPVMVVDEGRGTILYYGTAEQQESLGTLITELDTQSEQVTIRVYKLRNSKAVDVAELIQGLISETGAVGSAPLLPGGQQSSVQRRNARRPNAQQGQGESAQGDGTSIDSTAFVIANEAQNQIVVKARAGQQEDFERLIEQLDIRRPQVYIEARIVAVTADDRLRVSFENQLINANGSGGVLNSNFGLGSLPTTGQPLLGQKLVSGGLSGFTAAVIRSDQVPIVMRALANETDSRIISTPQLLVDDNTEATVASIDKIPVQSISRGDNNDRDTITFDRSEEAGTTLTVKPQIADAGYLRLEYELELSSFTSEGSATQPPSSQVNTLSSESITVPDDSTVVVGGLVLDANNRTTARIPLLGKIPLLGALFGDTNKGDRQTVLYVFLTPRILRDPNFADLRLLTKGPTERAKLPSPENLPPLTPRMMEIISTSKGEVFSQPARVPGPAPIEPMPLDRGSAASPGATPVRRSTQNVDEQNPD
jgi:type II secretion system protein D